MAKIPDRPGLSDLSANEALMLAASKVSSDSLTGKYLSEAIKSLSHENPSKSFFQPNVSSPPSSESPTNPLGLSNEQQKKLAEEARKYSDDYHPWPPFGKITSPLKALTPAFRDWSGAEDLPITRWVEPEVDNVNYLINMRDLAARLKDKSFFSAKSIEDFCANLKHIDRGSKVSDVDESLPALAPERWAHRKPEDKNDPILFIKRVYGKWIGKGLHTGVMQNLDDTLLREYKSLPKDSIPADARIPSYGEWVREQAKHGSQSPTQAAATLRREQRDRNR